MKNCIIYVSVVLMIWLLFVLTVGCVKLPEPIDRIQLFKALDQPGIPTAGSLADSQKDPMPTIVQEFSSSDKIFFGIRLSKDLEENVVFTKYTIFNKDTSTEFKIGLPEQLGPYEPAQVPLIAFEDPWTLPNEPGHYEFRVYLGNRIVSKALFNIGN
jgi:hypothetical protein